MNEQAGTVEHGFIGVWTKLPTGRRAAAGHMPMAMNYRIRRNVAALVRSCGIGQQSNTLNKPNNNPNAEKKTTELLHIGNLSENRLLIAATLATSRTKKWLGPSHVSWRFLGRYEGRGCHVDTTADVSRNKTGTFSRQSRHRYWTQTGGTLLFHPEEITASFIRQKPEQAVGVISGGNVTSGGQCHFRWNITFGGHRHF